MSIKLTNSPIDLADLQEEMNFIALNYMNDFPDWKIATENLETLLSQTASFFNEYMEDGDFPQLTQYWSLFATLSSKLCLNYGSALFNHLCTNHKHSKEFEKVENALLTAAMVMPNSNNQEYLKFLQHIEEPYKQSILRQGKTATISLIESIISQNYDLEKNLHNFYAKIRDNYVPS